MSETWYSVWLGDIEPVVVDKFTDQCVWVAGRRRRRDSWTKFYPTWEDAKAALVKAAEMKVDQERLALARAISALDVARKLTSLQKAVKP